MRSVLSALALISALTCGPAVAQPVPRGEPKVVLVTFDGVRWEDVFRGADPALAADKAFVEPDLYESWIKPAYLDPSNRRTALMPFVHGVMARDGVVIGDRDDGECARVANDMWFSYPGYNEILTGRPDPRIVENDDKWNENVTILEWLNKRAAFGNRVQMVGTWTLFPKIVNTKGGSVPVNSRLQGRYPTDVLTARFAREALRSDKPRLLYVAFGDTDELAHQGDYDQYLAAIERGDDFLRELWDLLQADPYYRGQTTLIVSTDHGRGHTPLASWKDHSAIRYHQLNPDYDPQFNQTGVIGSGDVWFAAMGPGLKSGERRAYRGGPCAESRQIAASILTLLGEDWTVFDAGAGPPFAFIAAGR
jgi:hypothetical protein